MPCKCKTIIEHMERFAPSGLTRSWDNGGLLLGDSEQQVKTVMAVLDIDDEIAEEAAAKGVDMIVTHHPLIFKPLNRIRKDDAQGRSIIKLIQNNISVYSAHTSLDMALGGVNDTLASVLGLRDVRLLVPECSEPMKKCETAHDVYNAENIKEQYGFARIGKLDKPVTLDAFAELVKKCLKTQGVRVVRGSDKEIMNVVVSSGAYSDIAKTAKQEGADIIVTGDLKYHDAKEIAGCGLCAVDAGHFPTENIIVPVLAEYILKLDNMGIKVIISEKSQDIFMSM